MTEEGKGGGGGQVVHHVSKFRLIFVDFWQFSGGHWCG